MAKINTTIEEYLIKARIITTEKYPNSSVEAVFIKQKAKAKEYNFIFNINDQIIKLYAWYDDDGISHNIVQGNKKPAQEILKNILEDVDVLFQRPKKPNSHSFRNFNKTIFEEIKREFSSFPYKIEDTQGDDRIKIFLDEVFNLTISYYPTQTLLVQGKNSPLWDNLFYFISEKLNLKSNEIIHNYIESNDELNSQNIEISSEVQEDSLRIVLGDDVYDDANILMAREKELLKTTCQFLSLYINSPDYSFMLVPAFRVIEGILRRIISVNNLTESDEDERIKGIKGKFYQFHNPGNKLGGRYCSMLNNDTILINILEKMYNIYCSLRLCYCHSDGINPRIINDKEEAIAIFNEICTLLKNVHNNVDKLFKIATTGV